MSKKQKKKGLPVEIELGNSEYFNGLIHFYKKFIEPCEVRVFMMNHTAVGEYFSKNYGFDKSEFTNDLYVFKSFGSDHYKDGQIRATFEVDGFHNAQCIEPYDEIEQSFFERVHEFDADVFEMIEQLLNICGIDIPVLFDYEGLSEEEESESE